MKKIRSGFVSLMGLKARLATGGIVLAIFCYVPVCQAQVKAIAINTIGAAPDSSAILDIYSTTQGVLFPRMTLIQRNAITLPATGLIIYNTDCNEFQYYNGHEWTSMINSSSLYGPVATVAGNITETSFSANWNSVAGATAYYLDVATDSAFTTYVTGYQDLKVNSDTTYSVTGLSCTNTYYYRVRSGDGCGNSANSGTISTTTSVCCTGPPAQPGAITGDTFFCASSPTQTYSISPVATATSYTWTVPAGATIISGPGTTSVNITFGSQSGSIGVSANNNCGSSAVSSLAVTICHLSGWQYYQPVTVFNTSGSVLTNFQTKVIVNYAAGKMNADFSDLRFVDDSCNLLSYWVESYVASDSAVVWIKVNSIPASGAIIYMYYGNNSAVTASSGTSTFLWFEDFSTISGWTVVSPFTLSTSGTVHQGTGSSGRFMGTGVGAGYARKDFPAITSNFILEYWARVDRKEDNCRPIGDGTNNLSPFRFFGNSCNTGVLGPVCNLQMNCNTPEYSYTSASWVFLQTFVNQTNHTYDLKGTGGSSFYVTGNTYNLSLNHFTRFEQDDGSTLYDIDNYVEAFKARKWASADPTVSFGSEQICP